MILSILLLVLFEASESRVTFPDSEVIQANDLVNNEASFNCNNGCKVYVDKSNDQLQVMHNGDFVATFTDIAGRNPSYPDGLELPAGQNYKLQSRFQPIPDFVFYAVSTTAPNYGGIPIISPQVFDGITEYNQSRYLTILSSSNAISCSFFEGSFPNGYPKIYSTGFDAAGDYHCTPAYQAQSQYAAENSQPAIYSAIITVDFGYDGKHSMLASPTEDGRIQPKIAGASSVYMSMGYVGCSFVGGQSYYSNAKIITEHFTITSDSLDISVWSNAVSPGEKVFMQVNTAVLNFYGTTSYVRSFGPGKFDVSLSWTRLTKGSSWAIQMDFGTPSYPQSSSPRSISTTSSGGAITLFVALITVLVCVPRK